MSSSWLTRNASPVPGFGALWLRPHGRRVGGNFHPSCACPRSTAVDAAPEAP